MKTVARQRLKELVTRFGTSICSDPKRCEGLLRDVCPDCRLEVAVLANAAREGIGEELLKASGGTGVHVLFQRLRSRLEENLWLSEDVAAWAVESWAFALGCSQGPS